MKIMKIGFLILGVILFSLNTICSKLTAQNNSNILEYRKSTEKILEKTADRILSETTYRFFDEETGKTYESTKGLPLKLTVKVESRYNDWHYTNGVLNFGMNELGNITGEKKYNEFVDKNLISYLTMAT